MSLVENRYTPDVDVELEALRLRDRARAHQIRRAAVIGAGVSGVAACRLLASIGADVRVLDDKDPTPATREALAGAELGRISAEALVDRELVVLSPGVPRSRPELARAIAERRLIGEIELATWFLSVPLVGITGTNGKSTTTALTAHILASAGRRVFAGGNLGRPLSDLVVSGESVEIAVVELSSYQLESLVLASFQVGCWLNLTPDHLDRYPDPRAYAEAKERLLERLGIHGFSVLNFADAAGRRAGSHRRFVRWFSTGPVPESLPGTFLMPNGQAIRRSLGDVETYSLDNPYLPGRHNFENMCAAIENTRGVGVDAARVQEGLATFRGLPHRLELVRERGGVRWYNDSKATNVDSAATGLAALDGPKLVIAGGRDKGAPWDLFADSKGVRHVFAIGEAAPIVTAAFASRGVPVEDVRELSAAIRRAAELARPGDLVVLAPACSSFDQFENYAARGDTFRRLVLALPEVTS